MTEVVYSMFVDPRPDDAIPLRRPSRGFICSRCGHEVEVRPRYITEEGPICRLCHINDRLEENNRRAHWVE